MKDFLKSERTSLYNPPVSREDAYNSLLSNQRHNSSQQPTVKKLHSASMNIKTSPIDDKQAVELIVGQSVRIKSLSKQLQDKDYSIQELSKKLFQYEEYAGQVDILKKQLQNMEQTLENQAQLPLQASHSYQQSIVELPTNKKAMSKKSKMNIIDDDQAVYKLQMSIDKKEKALQSKKLKQSISIMSEMKTSIKNIEQKVDQENQDQLQKLKLKNSQLIKENKMLTDSVNKLKKQSQLQDKQNDIITQKMLSMENENKELTFLVHNLNSENENLSKKTMKLSKDLECLPELKDQLVLLKDTTHMLEQEIENEKQKNNHILNQQMQMQYSTNMNTQYNSHVDSQSLYKKIEEYEVKNYDLLTENLELKDKNLQLTQEIRLMSEGNENDLQQLQMLIYAIAQLLRRANSSQNKNCKHVLDESMSEYRMRDIIGKAKVMFEELEEKIDLLKLNEVQYVKDQELLHYKVQSLKEQNDVLQNRINENQALLIEEQNKSKTSEIMIQDLQYEVNSKSSNNQELQIFQQSLQSQLLKLLQIFGKQAQSNLHLDHGEILNQISVKVNKMISDQTELSQSLYVLESQNDSLKQQNQQLLQQIENTNLIHEQSQQTSNMEQNQKISSLQQEVENLKETNIEMNTLVGQLSNQVIQQQNDNNEINQQKQSLIVRIKDVAFQKQILKRENRLLSIERDNIRLVIQQENYKENNNRRSNIKLSLKQSSHKLRKYVMLVVTAIRIKNNAKNKRLIHSHQLINQMDNNTHFDVSQIGIKSVPNSLLNMIQDCIDSQKYKAHQLDKQLQQKQKEVNEIQQRLHQYEEETLRQYESNERLTSQIRNFKDQKDEQLIEEKIMLTRQVGVLQEELNDTEKMYQQKIKNLKRDIDFKGMQLTSMQSLIKKKEIDIRKLQAFCTQLQQQNYQGNFENIEQVTDNRQGDESSNYSFADKN